VHAESLHTALPAFRRRWLILAAALCAAVLVYTPAANLMLAARLLIAIKSVADGQTGESLDVIQTRVHRANGAEDEEALVYRPAKATPARAVVLVPGISELGCYHPRLMALSRYLAANGFLVVTPDIRQLRRFRMSPEAVDQISFWFRQIPTLDSGSRIRVTGLSGISFSATLAVLAAARPDVRDRVSFIFGIGAYDDPLRCSQGWFAAGTVTMSPGYYPTRYYARWIVMLGALELVPRKEERHFLESALTDLLSLKPALPAPSDLSQTAQRWYRLALMPEDQSDPEITKAIEDHMTARLYKMISPEAAAAGIRCPVFLVHGAYDDLIPPEESRRLALRFVNVPVHVLVTPFLTHTHPAQQEAKGTGKVRAVTEIAGFFYEFARVVR
jgi:pimeloyl-ACP methyl ester carboxylesterase